MKKILFILIIFFSAFIVKALPMPVNITSNSAVLINMDNDQIVYEKEPDKEQILASLTKIMTAYTALQHIENLNERVTITEKDLSRLEGFTCAGLEVGDVVTYLDLLYAMMLPSGADASQTLAFHIAGSNEEFVKLMNQEALNVGMYHSNFADSYGGDDNNISTARELAILLREALINPTFYKVFTTKRYTLSNGLQVVNYTDPTAEFYGFDTSIILGSKSGYTPEAGLMLVSTAKINGVNYALVVCKSELNKPLTNHVIDSFKVYNYVSNHHYETRDLLKKGMLLKKIPVLDSTISEYPVEVLEDVSVFLSDEDYDKVTYDYHLVENLSTNNKAGDNLGYVDMVVDGEVIASYNAYLKEDIFEVKKESKLFLVILVFLAFFVLVLLSTNLIASKKN